MAAERLDPSVERRELGSTRPADIRAWIRGVQDRNVAASYQAGFAHVSSILGAAVDDKFIRENTCHARTVVRPKGLPVEAIP